MPTPLAAKSSVEEIRNRFDSDVDRFSNLATGQTSTIDALLTLELVAQAAISSTPHVQRVLDIGCGAGNTTLKLLEKTSPLDCDLVDLSQPMLVRAYQRISAVNSGKITTIQSDFRQANLPDQGYDVILAAAVLHHLRDDRDWEEAFTKLYRLTAPGGSVWITDLVSHESDNIHALMWERYKDYLCTLGGHDYQTKVFDYIAKEDSPRPVSYQLDLLRKVGFQHTDLLHKNSCFAAFGAIKSS